MNYFELFGIPVSLYVDPAVIKKTFYQLSREYHPDFYTNDTDAEQANALEMSAMLNKAYNIFQSQDATIRYVLQLKELIEEEEKYTLKPGFLMEVMEINEGLMDLQMDNDPQVLSELKEKSDQLLKEIYEEVAPVIENYSEGVTTTEALLQVKDYYYKKKYLKRILESIGGIPNIAPRS